jgi:hemin uptake protein HemP
MTTEQCPSANGDAPKDTLQSSPASLPAKAQSQIKRLSSKLLLSGDSEVEIEHRGQLYRLRQTALGKLILTK